MSKPTASQRRWLTQIATRNVTRSSHSWVHGMRCSGGYPSSSTYVMTCDLHDAGWIDAERIHSTYNTYRIVLTDAGREAIDASQPPGAATPKGGE
ncbi:MAG TPA: hypothetical protein VFI87_11150 [Hyphomicrobiaceae bacterium]|nr:hypothetical protein [Hyphomicrobiaceae bacterium]